MTTNLPLLFVLSLLTGCIEIDISVPSLPDIADYFNISMELTQLTLAVNFFGFCIASLVWGPLSDSYGRRRVMIIGNLVMLIGAASCVLASDIWELLAARFIQGIGASTSAVVVFAMIADVYSPEKAARLIGIMNSLLTIFLSIAPVIGSFINGLIGFRGNYFIIALLSLVSWIVLYFKLPETKNDKEKLQLAAIIKNCYILFTDRRFLYASVAPSIAYSGYMGFIACAPFLYMKTYHLSAAWYAFNQGIIIGIFSLFSILASRIHNFFGERNCVIYGTALLFLGASLSLPIGLLATNSPLFTTGFMIIFAIGSAITYPIIFSRSLNIFPRLRGAASSIIMSTRTLLCGLFIAFMSQVYDGTLLSVSAGLLLSGMLTVWCTFKLLKLISFATKRT